MSVKYNLKYKLLGFLFGEIITARVLVLSTGKVIAMPLKELDDSEISDDLNPHEIKALHKKLYMHHNITTEYEMSDRNERSWYAYFSISLALAVIYILSTVSGVKPVHLSTFNLIIPPAIFFYPLTFILVDILNEFYGLKMTRRTIIISFIANILFVGGLWMSTLLPDLKEWPHDQAYRYFIHNIIAVLLASSLAYLISENINSWLLCKIKVLTNSRYLFVRVITSSVCAAAIDSIIFCSIAFYGVLSLPTIKAMIVSQFIIKLIYAVSGVFPIYGTRKLFRKFIHTVNQ